MTGVINERRNNDDRVGVRPVRTGHRANATIVVLFMSLAGLTFSVLQPLWAVEWSFSHPAGVMTRCALAKVFNCVVLDAMTGVSQVAVPQYQRTAEFFRALGHPVRVRVLELLGDQPRVVRDHLDEVGAEASSMSQQLAVLPQTGIIQKLPDGRYCLPGCCPVGTAAFTPCCRHHKERPWTVRFTLGQPDTGHHGNGAGKG